MDEFLQMTVEPLTSIDKRVEIIENWRNMGLASHEYDSLREEMLSDESAEPRWFGVMDKKQGMIIALFDVRCVPLKGPQYHKSMRIHFAPGLNPEDWEDSGQPFSAVEDIITRTVAAMSFAFRHLVEQADQNNERMVKIYSDHPLRLLMFQGFARNLKEQAPSDYEVNLYKKWVEIKHTGGRHGSCSVSKNVE